jgi:hypothetical protein
MSNCPSNAEPNCRQLTFSDSVRRSRAAQDHALGYLAEKLGISRYEPRKAAQSRRAAGAGRFAVRLPADYRTMRNCGSCTNGQSERNWWASPVRFARPRTRKGLVHIYPPLARVASWAAPPQVQ